MSNLLELADRVEALTGPDREVDRHILASLGTHVLEKRGNDRKAWWYSIAEHGRSYSRHSNDDGGIYPPPVPRYTASLDAAMTLVPEGWQCDGLKWWARQPSTCTLVETKMLEGQWTRFGGEGRTEARAATPALALCAASLRARHAVEGDRG